MSAVVLVGLSHHVAPVELRERVTLDLDRPRRRSRARSATPCASRPATAPSSTSPACDEERAVAALEELAGEPLDGVLYRLHDEAAALHLFRVAAGLDSLVPGRGRDPRPGARRRTRRRRPARCSTASSGRRSRVGKRVRTETAIGESPASVSSAAAALAAQVFGDLERPARAAGRRRAGSASSPRRTSPRAERRSPTSRTARAEHARASSPHRFGGAAVALDELADGSATSTSSSRRRARPSSCCTPATCPRGAGSRSSSSTSPCRGTSTRRSRARRLLPLRHRRPRGRGRRDARRPARRGRARRAARRRGGRAVPRVARVARRRAGDRVAARAGRGDPLAPSSRRCGAAPTTSGARSSR